LEKNIKAMPDTPEKYQWVKYAVLPVLAGLYPFILPVLERQYGIEETKREAVKTEINEVMQSEETLESLSIKLEEHRVHYTTTLEDLTRQINDFNEARLRWNASKAITLRLYPNGEVKYTAFDGMEYPAYWKENEKVWKYVKNGNSYIIFTKE
jgi:hypothetical protein